MTTPISQSNMDDIFLKIAERHCAYADSAPCIRGRDDIVAFARAVLALEEEEMAGIQNIKASVSKEALFDKLQDAAQASPWLMVGESWVEWCMDFMRSKRITHEVAQVICSDKGRIVIVTDPAKIHEVFEHDQQCDDMAGVPVHQS